MIANRLVAPILGGAMLSSCGTYVPEKLLVTNAEDANGMFESVIVNNVKCELRLGVRRVLVTFPQGGRYNDVSWLAGWGALVTLKITVDEKSSLSPGVSFVGTNFSAPVGATGGAGATRIETIAFSYSFADLLAEDALLRKNNFNADDCSLNEKGILIESNLKIGDFIRDKMIVAANPGAVQGKTPGAPPFSVFSYQATFVSNFGGTAAPTWKFIKTSVDSASALFSASRQKTHDVSITLGPALPATKSSPARLSGQAIATHESAVNAMFISTAIQSQQLPR